jgi:hypothetical protein
VTYVAYTEQNGFPSRKFTLPNHSNCSMRNYSQDILTLEGGELRCIWNDERVPPDWLEAQVARTSTPIHGRPGFIVTTYTPVGGWTGTVQMIEQNAETVLRVPAFLLPADGGEPDVPRAFGFSGAEEMERAVAEGRTCIPPRLDDIASPPGKLVVDGDREHFEMEDGRLFEAVPRIKKAYRPDWGIIYFQPMDNPHGGVLQVWEDYKRSDRERKLIKLYGVATRSWAPQFPLFSERVHVLPDEQVQSVRGLNYMIIDPTPGGRPFVMVWVRVTPDGTHYIYREWPSQVRRPMNQGGAFGQWAVPSGRKGGNNDGDYGEAAQPIAWGVIDYCKEIGMLEGWKPAAIEALEARRTRAPDDEDEDEDWEEGDEQARKWGKWNPRADDYEGEADPSEGAREAMEGRWIDSRAATAPRIENDRVATLQTYFEELGLDVGLCPGNQITDGVRRLNELMHYDTERPVGPGNLPRFFVSDRCKNVIFCLQNWLWAEGNKGPTKDFVDAPRYAVDLRLES